MDRYKDALRRMGGPKNIAVVAVFFLVFGGMYACKKGSIRAAVFPALLGLVAFVAVAFYAALRNPGAGPGDGEGRQE